MQYSLSGPLVLCYLCLPLWTGSDDNEDVFSVSGNTLVIRGKCHSPFNVVQALTFWLDKGEKKLMVPSFLELRGHVVSRTLSISSEFHWSGGGEVDSHFFKLI